MWGGILLWFELFPGWLVMLSTFSCTCWSFMFSLEKYLFRSSSHFLKKTLFTFREMAREGEREGEKQWSATLHRPPARHVPGQPRNVPWPEIEPATLRFAGQCSIHWATPARALCPFFNQIFFLSCCIAHVLWIINFLSDMTCKFSQFAAFYFVLFFCCATF